MPRSDGTKTVRFFYLGEDRGAFSYSVRDYHSNLVAMITKSIKCDYVKILFRRKELSLEALDKIVGFMQSLKDVNEIVSKDSAAIFELEQGKNVTRILD